MSYKLVIFDLDGTILNTLQDLCASVNAALEVMNLPHITLEQTRQFIGHGIRSLVLQASNHSEHIEDLLQRFKEYYKEHYNDFTKAYSGIEEVFRYCKKNQIHMGVLTNKVEDIAINLVETHFPNTMEFVYGEVPDRTRKPDPVFLLSVIEQYGFQKEEVVYIGDSEVDIKTCMNAGIDGIFVTYGFRSKEELMRFSKRFVDSPLKIIDYLGE